MLSKKHDFCHLIVWPLKGWTLILWLTLMRETRISEHFVRSQSGTSQSWLKSVLRDRWRHVWAGDPSIKATDRKLNFSVTQNKSTSETHSNTKQKQSETHSNTKQKHFTETILHFTALIVNFWKIYFKQFLKLPVVFFGCPMHINGDNQRNSKVWN